MFLSEYQAKEILNQYDVPVPEGRIAHSAAEAEARGRELSCKKYVVKAQIRAGGRGLAGGVKFAATPSSVAAAARELLGDRLVTEQTGAKGELVETVSVEASEDIAQSFYVAAVIDQRTARPTVLMSSEGGEAFEAKAQKDSDIVRHLAIGPAGEVASTEIEMLVASVGLSGAAVPQAVKIVEKLLEVFFAYDCTLIEINPLAVTRDDRVIALDAKMVIDANALERHPELAEFVADDTMDPVERTARDNEINFVKLEGDIGVVVNGAGLGLATNDMLIEAGGRPANFMDIRTTASSFQIATGISLLLRDPKVKAILVNIHGGGMTVCDTIAEAISFAYSKSDRRPPIVYRAAGQNAAWSETMMKDRRLPYVSAPNMTSAIRQVVELAGGR